MSNQRYHLEPPSASRPDSQLLYITSACSDKDWHSLEHTHYFAEIFYVTRNSGHFLINGKKIPVTAGDLVFINPGVPHTELGSPKAPWEYLALGIDGLQFSPLGQKSFSDFQVYSPGAGSKSILSCFETILKEARHPDDYSGEICQTSFELLLTYTSRYTSQELLAAPPKKAARECRLLEQYIKEHFAEEISLEDLSRFTNLNKYYLVHAFKDYKGVSPMNFLTMHRIQEAMHLLETTNYPITKIAGMTGFSSQSYFSQAFRRLALMTPNQYRKQIEQTR